MDQFGLDLQQHQAAIGGVLLALLGGIPPD